MNWTARIRAAVLASAMALFACAPTQADDSAASIAVGGLVARRETRIVMAKEVLRISTKKVVVDYDFRNDSDQNVTTEVAFPIPPYENEWDEADLASQSFQSFKLWVDGEPVRCQTEAKAFLKEKDVSDAVAADDIDIASFGHFRLWVNAKGEEQSENPDFARLPAAERKKLIKAGLFNDQGTYGLWTVHLQYHWTQSFPAHSTIHIRHEYSPALGYTQVNLSGVEESLGQIGGSRKVLDDPEGVKLLTGFCPARPFLNALARQLRETELRTTTPDEKMMAGTAYPHWVDFILTSANTWKRPIEDFTLVVKRVRPKPEQQQTVSFCSPANGNVKKLDADTFQVHLTNFVPTSELHIGFFDVPEPKQTTAAEIKQ